jgi:hypothetical protein
MALIPAYGTGIIDEFRSILGGRYSCIVENRGQVAVSIPGLVIQFVISANVKYVECVVASAGDSRKSSASASKINE